MPVALSRPVLSPRSRRRAADRFIPNGGYYGWTIVVAGLICSALSAPGQSYLLSLYVDSFIRDLQIPRVTVASLYGGATIAAAALIPLVGRLADRLTMRVYLAGVLLLIAAALVGLSMVRGPITLVVAFVALRLLGQGAIGLGTLTATVRWFRRYRARALAIVGLGYAVGEAIFPGVVVTLLDRVGWRGSLLVLAAAYLLLFAPLVAALARQRRPDEPIDGEGGPAAGDPPPARRAVDLVEEPSYSVREAMRTRVFWPTLAAVTITPMALTGLIFHQVTLFERIGWSVQLVPPAFLAFAVAGVIGGILSGLALERVAPGRALVVSALVGAGAVLSIWLPAPPLVAALLYGTLLGASNAIAGNANAVIWPAFYGIASLGAIRGIVTGTRNGMTAIGPLVVAAAIDFGGDMAAGAVIIGMFVLLAGISLLLKPPGGK